MNDPYAILGVSRSASDDEIKKAYRNLCRKYHPDKNPGNEAAEEMFKIVNDAYDQIMNERKNGQSYDSGEFGASDFWKGQGASQSEADDDRYLQAAANYINSGHYSEALNVLSLIKTRGAQWYYLSARVSYGMGNNYEAMRFAEIAVSIEPNNLIYRQFAARLQSGDLRYSNMRSNYGYGGDDSDFCMRLCALNLCLNACCNCCY